MSKAAAVVPANCHGSDWQAAHLATILESSQDAIVTKSLEGIITGWNPAAERIFGYLAQEALGSPISIILPPDRAAEEPDILARLRRGEKIEQFETSRMRKDGKRITVLLTISPVRDAGGTIVGACKVARDITAQKLVLDQVSMERERLQVTLTSIGDGVIVTDRRGYVEFLNPVAETLTGWKQAQAKGQPLEAVFNIVNETSRSRVESPVARAMREGVIVGLANHTILLARDGSEFAIDDSAAPIRDADGKISGVILVFRDVTGQRAVEATQARLSAIVEGSEDAIIGKDFEGRIISWNRGAEKMFGYSQQEALGRPITMLIPPERLREETDILQRLRRGERVAPFDTVRMAKDRRKVEVSVSVSPIQDAGGQVVGASKIVRDISQKKNAERQLAQAHQQLKDHAQELEHQVAARTAELKQSLAELETFSASLSHDLKAPLRQIAGWIQVVRDDYGQLLPAEALEQIQHIVKTCARLGRFVDNVLSYAQLRAGSMELGRVDLDKLLPQILEEHPHAQQANAEVKLERPLLAVVGHDGLLTQVIANLVSNAVKFVPAGTRPKLRIWTQPRGDRVRLWVEDNGIGIAKADQQKVFELFTRLHDRNGYSGSGIGLAVVQRAVQRLGGEVGVESQEGNGSRFWVELRSGSPEGRIGLAMEPTGAVKH